MTAVANIVNLSHGARAKVKLEEGERGQKLISPSTSQAHVGPSFKLEICGPCPSLHKDFKIRHKLRVSEFEDAQGGNHIRTVMCRQKEFMPSSHVVLLI